MLFADYEKREIQKYYLAVRENIYFLLFDYF